MANGVDILDASNATVEVLTEQVTDADLGITGQRQHIALQDGTPGSTHKLIVDSSGRAKVDASGVPVPVTDNGGSLTIDGTVGVSGTVPSSVADGSNVVLGATTDAEATANGSINALLKRIRTLLSGGLPAALGSLGGLKVEPQSGIAASVSSDSIGAAPLAETSLAGATPFKLISAATTNATSVKGSVGKVFSIVVTNQNAAVRYLKLYDKATAPTVGTDTPKWVLAIPGNATGAGMVIALPMPLKFANGIAFALTTGVADTDTAAVAANEIVVNLGYV